MLDEAALFVALTPLLEADLSRPWQTTLVATDASVAYGFGVSEAHADPDLVREIGRFGEQPGRLIRLHRDGGVSDEPERFRKHTALTIPLSKAAFRTVISSKRRWAAHSSTLETCGVVLGLRWLLRSTARHAKRTTFLIDAQAVLGAIAKGRSSSGAIKRDVRHAAALILAGDIWLRTAYIPSEDNPADEPSRGIVRLFRRRRHVVPNGPARALGKHPVAKRHTKETPRERTGTGRSDRHYNELREAGNWRRLIVKMWNRKKA